MSQYTLPPVPAPGDPAGRVDPNSGFLCFTTHWQPDPKADDPDMPGRKVQMSSFIPAEPDSPCLCGSGKSFGDCCRLNPLWHPICPSPGDPALTYSLIRPQSARFQVLDVDAFRHGLTDDLRLQCVEDQQERGFWLLFGEPVLEDRYGIICFGDVELQRERALIVSAMSDVRMHVLLAVLREAIGGCVVGLPAPPGEMPQGTYQDIYGIDKWTGKSKTLRGMPPSRPRRGKKREGR